MNPAPPEMSFKVHGLDCAEEVAVLKREVGPAVGGEGRLSFDILNGRMTVTGADGVAPEAVQKAVAATGMRAEPWQGAGPDAQGQPFWGRWGRTILTAGSGLLTLAGFLTHLALAGSIRAALGSEAAGAAHHVPAAARALYGLAILAGVWNVLPKALFAARRLRPDMNLLMVVAVAGAVAIGEWFEGATVAFLFALSLALEAWSVGRARRAVEALLDLAPPTVRLLREGREE